jgi:hypothetical protein
MNQTEKQIAYEIGRIANLNGKPRGSFYNEEFLARFPKPDNILGTPEGKNWLNLSKQFFNGWDSVNFERARATLRGK